MVSQKKKRRQRRAAGLRPLEPLESRTAEAVTVCWTVTLTTLFFANLAAIVAHFYVVACPPAQKMAMLRELLLYAGVVAGAVSLGLLPVVYRYRQTPPPRGLVAFGISIASAPILAVVLRTLR